MEITRKLPAASETVWSQMPILMSFTPLRGLQAPARDCLAPHGFGQHVIFNAG
jgi:hypothetical protein